MTDDERRFAERAMRRKGVFLALSVAGIAIATALAVYYVYEGWGDAEYPIGIRTVLVILILLNSRQNLRQYKYAAILEKTVGP